VLFGDRPTIFELPIAPLSGEEKVDFKRDRADPGSKVAVAGGLGLDP
jgi:hypothetical protein